MSRGADQVSPRSVDRADRQRYHHPRCDADRPSAHGHLRGALRINIAGAPGIVNADLTAISANKWLVANAPLTRGDFTFYAETAGRRLAAHLGCSETAALFVRERTTCAAMRAIIVRTNAVGNAAVRRIAECGSDPDGSPGRAYSRKASSAGTSSAVTR
jgi:hypothetical protein